MNLEVAIEPDLCIGSGDCVRLLPAAFSLDDAAGVAVPREGARTADEETVLRAALGCPTQAIRVVRGGAVLHESNG